MVEAHGDVADLPDDDLAVPDDGAIGDAVEPEDRDLGMVDERGDEEPAELAGARDRERRVAQLLAVSDPAARPVREPPHLDGDLVDASPLAAAHDRDDQPVVGLDGDADVDAVEEDDVVALEAGVELGEPRERPAAAWIASGTSEPRSTPVKSHSSTKVTAGTSRCVRVTCSTIARRMPLTGMRRPSCAVALPRPRRERRPPRSARRDRSRRVRPARRRAPWPAAGRPASREPPPSGRPARPRRAARSRAPPAAPRVDGAQELLARLADHDEHRADRATSPSSTRILSTVPARGDGISTVVLSVCTSTSG